MSPRKPFAKNFEDSLKRICGNCAMYEKGVCIVRRLVYTDGSHISMPRRYKQAACDVFEYKKEGKNK